MTVLMTGFPGFLGSALLPWVGVDRGLSAFLVAATTDGRELARNSDPPKALAAGIKRQRRLAKSLSRKQKGSHNHRQAAEQLARHHHRIANVRRHFLHQVSNEMAKTHDRLVLGDLNVTGNAAQPPPCTGHLRCGLGRVRSTAGLQTTVAGRHDGHR
jgi:Probable transposase